MIFTLAFYLFACVAVAAGLLTVTARNPVHSVLWLILTFFSAAGLFVLMGAEFVAMLMLIVYVGAVAVLFLFVVMMLDVDFAELKSGMVSYLPLAGLMAVILLLELGMVIGISGDWIPAEASPSLRAAVAPMPEDVTNTAALGQLIYTRYVYLFQAAGLILLTAMIGAIVLTLRHRVGVKRQNVLEQMYRDPNTAVELMDVKPRQGI
ncbi:NADH-quinone oxidoreductase subunit J [Paroceanicella profunda]|uniref:NADH-quinone oxidoreductase subunit J n=1 Tax=Paroceanicella profunda TaxID=2579971 RepID=A0A5B8FVY1_9RHOB|nr:NADH-quinone oxidoreductase subunit J [Paroceanicella profunda]QDL92996.1 NADH-quinone oxidoreductase subunit J [Paroceanicella profunda]